MKMTPAILSSELLPKIRHGLIHHFDTKSKMQSQQRKHSGSPPPKKFKRDGERVIMIDFS